ncbi:MAG: hypothetical protein J6A79_14715 [Clostridia bacterium]|nr:hypothetical protein [Clostridia bacterium]
MIVWILILILLSLGKASFCKKGITQYYISREGTDAVRGIFILLILASHFVQYVPALTLPVDTYYLRLRTFLGQFVVSMFLFYSGYGVTLSFAEKGEKYRKSFLKKRILNTLLVFDLAVVFYFIVQYELGNRYSLSDYLMAMTAWESIGNSNWYIFDILVLYFLSWITIKNCQRENAEQEILLLTTGVLVFTQLLLCAKKESWWYDTIFCYPLGAVFYYLRPAAEKILNKDFNYYLILLLTGVLFFIIHKIWEVHLVFYEMSALLFVIFVVLVTMKLEIRSHLLCLAGKHLNELYLVQRLPMILLGRVTYIKNHVYLYFVLSVFFAIIFAYLFGRLVDLLRGKMILYKT